MVKAEDPYFVGYLRDLSEFRAREDEWGERLSAIDPSQSLGCPRLEIVPRLAVSVAERAECVPLPVNRSLPDWIARSGSYNVHRFTFASATKLDVMAVAYYFGVAVLLEYPWFAWAVEGEQWALAGEIVVTLAAACAPPHAVVV